MARSFLQGLTGSFAYPAAENPTQAMIEPAYRAMGLDWRYINAEVRPEGLADAVRGARAMGWRGFNCSLPHKVAVIRHLDRLSPAAEMIGAVNCVILNDGQAIGENTDGKGFLQSVEAVRSVKGLKGVILGAGGAARAIAVELALAGVAALTIVNRTESRGRELAEAVRAKTGVPSEYVVWEKDYRVPIGTDLVVNATSIGLYPDVQARVPLDLDSLSPRMLVCDVIPNPPRTRLIREAEARGCHVLDGLGMLVNQGVIGIRLWTGQEPDPDIMRAALESVLTTA